MNIFKHCCDMSNSMDFNITIHELMDVAIIPVLKNIVNIIVASVINRDVLGYYDIARLFITGNLVRIKNYNKSYQHILETEICQELERVLLYKAYEIPFDVFITTYQQQEIAQIYDSTAVFKRYHFCHEKLSKGELRTVSSSTHLLRRSVTAYARPSPICIEVANSVKWGFSSELILQEEEMTKKRTKVYIYEDDSFRKYENSDIG